MKKLLLLVNITLIASLGRLEESLGNEKTDNHNSNTSQIDIDVNKVDKLLD